MSTTSKPPQASLLENTTWILESYGEPENLLTVLEGTEITARFDSSKSQVRGSAGANSYSGSYQISDNKLSIQQIAHTEMFRLDPEGVMDQEYLYLKALQSAESYQVQNGELQINCGEQILIYTADTDQEKPDTATTIAPEPETETASRETAEKAKESVPMAEPDVAETGTLQLSDVLTTDCERADTSGSFRHIGLAEGGTAVDFTLKNTDGKAVSLSGLLNEKPVVMVFGSFT